MVVALAVGVGGATVMANTDDTLENAWTQIRAIITKNTQQDTRLAALESRHSIDCATVKARYTEGYNQFLILEPTKQERFEDGRWEVEEYLDDVTSNAHYTTYWTEIGAEAELARCKVTLHPSS